MKIFGSHCEVALLKGMEQWEYDLIKIEIKRQGYFLVNHYGGIYAYGLIPYIIFRIKHLLDYLKKYRY